MFDNSTNFVRGHTAAVTNNSEYTMLNFKVEEGNNLYVDNFIISGNQATAIFAVQIIVKDDRGNPIIKPIYVTNFSDVVPFTKSLILHGGKIYNINIFHAQGANQIMTLTLIGNLRKK
jgi:hypothetical protein